MKIIILLSIFLSSCSGFQRVGHIDPVFKSYVKSFEEHKGARVRDMDIIFNVQSNYRVGICIRRTERPRVEIDPIFWMTANTTMKENLIFHELGHCDLNLSHTTEYSIMHPSIIDPVFYNDNREYLINLLFKRGM